MLARLCLCASLTIALAFATVPLLAGDLPQPKGIKSRAEIFEDADLEKSKNDYFVQADGAAIEVLEQKGRAFRIRCGNREGWVDRGDLDFELPSSEECKQTAGGSGRGSNLCR